MGSVADKLDYLADTKEAIKNAIEAKGVEIASTATFRSYADSIDEIQGGAAYEIDTSKVDYSIGSNTDVKTNNGRILQGFATMTNNRIQPLDTSGNWLDIDWTKDWEIGVAFKMVNQLAKSFILGTGYNLTYPISESPCLAIQSNGTMEFWIYQDGSHYTDGSYYIDGNSEIISLDTWYHAIIKHSASNTSIIFKISKDMKVYTTLETLTMTQYYNNRAALIFGGLWQNQSTWSTNNLLIDTYNTYIKDDSGKIIWGAFAKSFDNGKYPIISGEYELYDYIESDGTQIIDMGFAPKNGDEIEVNTYLLSSQTEPAWIWAATDPSIFIGTTQYSNYKSIYSNSSSGSTASYIKNDLNMDLLTASRDYTAPLCIFGFKLSGTYYPGISTRLYSVRYNNNYYLPCKRKSDGIFGLYDVANKAFLTDALNGNPFIGGNLVGNFDIFPKYDYVNDITYQCIGDYGLRSTLEVDASNSDLMNTSAVTFEACIKFDSYTQKTNNQVARFIEFGNSQLTGRLGTFGIKWRSGETIENNFVYFDDVLGSADFHGLFEWNEGETHTVSCIKKTDGACKLYIDGNIIFTGTSTLTISSTMIDKVTLRALYQNYQPANNTNGEVFMWRIYARELSEKEIMQNYKTDYQNYIE